MLRNRMAVASGLEWEVKAGCMGASHWASGLYLMYASSREARPGAQIRLPLQAAGRPNTYKFYGFMTVTVNAPALHNDP